MPQITYSTCRSHFQINHGSTVHTTGEWMHMYIEMSHEQLTINVCSVLNSITGNTLSNFIRRNYPHLILCPFH